MVAPVTLENSTSSKKPLEVEMGRLVKSIAKSLYKTTPEIKNYGASSCGVWGLHFEDKKVDRVIKLGVKSSGSLLREQKIIQSLHKFDLPIPKIEFTQQDLPNVWIPFMVMPKISNATLKDACVNDRPFALAKCRQAGEFIDRLSRVPIESIDIQPDCSLMPDDFKEDFTYDAMGMNKWHKVVEKLKKWQFITPDLEKHLLAVKEKLERKDYQNLMHQDFIPRQILVNHQQFAVIDWETTAIGSSLVDIGDFLGGIRRSLRNKDNRGAYVKAFLDGFCSSRSLSEAEIADIALWETYSTVNVAVAMGRRKKLEQAQKYLQIARERSSIYEYQILS